jgi:hypothetical protein
LNLSNWKLRQKHEVVDQSRPSENEHRRVQQTAQIPLFYLSKQLLILFVKILVPFEAAMELFCNVNHVEWQRNI